MRNLLIAGVAPLALIAVPAAAQETQSDRPFAGVYIGASGGYDVQGNDSGSSILFDRGSNGSFGEVVTTGAGANAFSPGFCNGRARAATPIAGCDNDEDGWSYNVRVGADTQVGPLTVGIIGEFGKSEISDSVSAFSTTPANYVMTREVEWEATARARAGLAVNTTLFYGTFGVGYASIENSFTSTNTANSFAVDNRNREFGWIAGGGIEQKLSRNISIGLEGLFHEYRDDDARVTVGQGTSPATNPFVLAGGVDFARSDRDFRWYSARAVVNFRF